MGHKLCGLTGGGGTGPNMESVQTHLTSGQAAVPTLTSRCRLNAHPPSDYLQSQQKVSTVTQTA